LGRGAGTDTLADRVAPLLPWPQPNAVPVVGDVRDDLDRAAGFDETCSLTAPADDQGSRPAAQPIPVGRYRRSSYRRSSSANCSRACSAHGDRLVNG
jgi:hypothetical protein